MKLPKLPIAIIAVAIVGLAAIGYLSLGGRPGKVEAPEKTAVEKPVLIGMSMGMVKEDRWKTDMDLFANRVEELGGSVLIEYVNTNADEQLRQAEKLINSGVQVLVVVPDDAAKAAAIVDRAHRAGVKVIAYDRLIRDSDVDFYVSFDNVKVGRMEAEGVTALIKEGTFAYIGGAPTDNNASLLKEGSMAVLKPLIDSGSVKLAVDEFTPNWQPDIAYKTIKEYLATGGKLDAVVAANDGTAFGVIQALEEKGLAGKVPVSGQDAELAACRRVVSGTQAVTVYKPIHQIARKAADLAVSMARGEQPESNGVTDNGRLQVPSYLLEPIAVTAANMADTVIKDGFHTAEEIYANQTTR